MSNMSNFWTIPRYTIPPSELSFELSKSFRIATFQNTAGRLLFVKHENVILIIQFFASFQMSKEIEVFPVIIKNAGFIRTHKYNETSFSLAVCTVTYSCKNYYQSH